MTRYTIPQEFRLHQLSGRKAVQDPVAQQDRAADS
jgi:hypothetical protein